jgi:deferrochelatase/peroxidase EfeB
MTKRNLDLICRHCLRSYDEGGKDEDGKDYGNYGTGLCFGCFEEDQESLTEPSSIQLMRRRLAFLYT